jgi:N-acetylmuramoyl-L-alanine amidase
MNAPGAVMSLIRREVLEGVQRILLAALVVIALAVITIGMHAIWTWGQVSAGASATADVSTSEDGTQVVIPSAVPATGLLPTRAASAAPLGSAPTPTLRPKVGIVAGHWKNDSGAVCPDGLAEVEINVAVAELVVSLLSRAGYDVEMLAEFSPQLNGYQASALVSIHADSCNVPDATGFKVARVSASQVPELEDWLVACLIEKYHEATGLPFHKNSITYDMTEYHAFYEIAPETPAAIIEVGFMAADRRLLTRRQDLVAHGIVNGIKKFIEDTR